MFLVIACCQLLAITINDYCLILFLFMRRRWVMLLIAATDVFQNSKWPTSDHLMRIIKWSCRKKKHPASHFRGEKCLLHNIWILHHCKSFQNAPEGLKYVMIGLGCKWSLTFHSMSRLSSLMATAPQSCYIRDIHPGVAWLAHWEEHILRAKFRFGAKDCGCRGSAHIYSSAVAGLCNICQRGRGPLISA